LILVVRGSEECEGGCLIEGRSHLQWGFEEAFLL